MFRMFFQLTILNRTANPLIHRTASRKNFTTVSSFIDEPDSRAQCVALEDNVKEFGLTYFGMKDRRQGELKYTIILSLTYLYDRYCSHNWT
jgi:hypothetical protein